MIGMTIGKSRTASPNPSPDDGNYYQSQGDIIWGEDRDIMRIKWRYGGIHHQISLMRGSRSHEKIRSETRGYSMLGGRDYNSNKH